MDQVQDEGRCQGPLFVCRMTSIYEEFQRRSLVTNTGRQSMSLGLVLSYFLVFYRQLLSKYAGTE